MIMVIGLTLLLLGQEPMGKVTKSEFLSLVADLGFTTIDDAWIHGAQVRDSKTTARLTIYCDNKTPEEIGHVRDVSGHYEFDVPKSVDSPTIRAWQKEDKLEKVRIDTYLGGRIAVTAYIATPQSTHDEIKKSLETFLGACRSVGTRVARLGGAPAKRPHEIGKAALNLDDRIFEVDSRDVSYIRQNLKWGNQGPAGGKGWYVGVKVKGVSFYFNGWGGQSYAMIWTGTIENSNTLKWLSSDKFTWGKATLNGTSVQISADVKTEKGLTIREFVGRAEAFAKAVKALGGRGNF